MTLGIEAARAAVLAEIRDVLFFDGGYINYRHVSILLDVMIFHDSLTAVSRHGTNHWTIRWRGRALTSKAGGGGAC
jgi:hypothetical protein